MNAIKIALLLSCLLLVAESFSVTKVKEADCDSLCSSANFGNDLHGDCCRDKGHAGASCIIINGNADGSCVDIGRRESTATDTPPTA